jgi:hypothetical protein
VVLSRRVALPFLYYPSSSVPAWSLGRVRNAWYWALFGSTVPYIFSALQEGGLGNISWWCKRWTTRAALSKVVKCHAVTTLRDWISDQTRFNFTSSSSPQYPFTKSMFSRARSRPSVEPVRFHALRITSNVLRPSQHISTCKFRTSNITVP